jgi:hypothetical protein
MLRNKFKMKKALALVLFLSFLISGLNAQEKNKAELEKMRGLVYSEDPQINSLAEKIFSQCIFSKLLDPLPPALPHKWFSPGGGYIGQWVWDTQFVLAAYAPMGEDTVIRGVYDNYWHTIRTNPEAPKGTYRYGMVPNFLKEWPPLGYSQIPILAWGMMQVYRQTGDLKLLQESLPYLVAFDQWYSTERDVDHDGLIEYGAYKPIGKAGMLQTARFETFDYFPTMDSMKMTHHPTRAEGGEWYGNVEGVEQTCFLLMSERAIVEMAEILGDKKLARQYKKVIARRIDAMQKKMWSLDKKFFFSLDRDSDRPIDVRSIQGFLTMCCDAATKEQAKSLVSELKEPAKWWCAYPVPTVALNDAKFSAKGFWRGDMWPVTTYLVAYGLNRYGYHDEARQLTDKLVELSKFKGVNERYNGLTGQSLGVNGLGMSCSVWSMIVENYYGITGDFTTICLPKNAKGRHLRLGQLEVSYPEDDQVLLISDFQRSLKVVFPNAKRDGQLMVFLEGKQLSKSALRKSPNAVEFKAEPDKHYLIKLSHEN